MCPNDHPVSLFGACLAISVIVRIDVTGQGICNMLKFNGTMLEETFTHKHKHKNTHSHTHIWRCICQSCCYVTYAIRDIPFVV